MTNLKGLPATAKERRVIIVSDCDATRRAGCCMMDDHERSYKQLVAGVVASLKKADLERLDYFYREPLRRACCMMDDLLLQCTSQFTCT